MLALGIAVVLLIAGVVLILSGLRATGMAVAASGGLLLVLNYAVTALYRRGLRRDVESDVPSGDTEQQHTGRHR